MMKRKRFILFTLLALVATLGLVGCSRTIDDIAKWKAKGNIEKLIQALEDPKVEVRQAAAVALGELKAEPAVDALAVLFSDPEERVTLAAVDALAAIGTDSTTTPLIAIRSSALWLMHATSNWVPRPPSTAPPPVMQSTWPAAMCPHTSAATAVRPANA